MSGWGISMRDGGSQESIFAAYMEGPDEEQCDAQIKESEENGPKQELKKRFDVSQGSNMAVWRNTALPKLVLRS